MPAFVPPPPPAYGSYLLASWGYRAGAIGIDVLLAVALGVGVWGLSRLGGGSGTSSLGAGVIAAFFGWPLLMAIPMWANQGQSIGKRVASIHVLRENGRPASFWWSVLRDTLCRSLFFFIPFAVLVDYLFATGASRQTLHDKMTSTHVVQGPAYASRQAPAVVGGIAGLAAVIGVFMAISVARHNERLGHGYTLAERDAFVHGCADGGTEKECGCLFDYLKTHLPHARFVEFARNYNRDPEHTHLPPEFLAAGDHCGPQPSPSPGSDGPEGS
jgi:uncharacterized RDD family membrane protein YckC